MTTMGALVGLATGVSWAWGFLVQAKTLLTFGSALQGRTWPARAMDVLSLTASSSAREKRIRDLEGERLEDRVLRAQARVLSTTRALSNTSLQETMAWRAWETLLTPTARKDFGQCSLILSCVQGDCSDQCEFTINRCKLSINGHGRTCQAINKLKLGIFLKNIWFSFSVLWSSTLLQCI